MEPTELASMLIGGTLFILANVHSGNLRVYSSGFEKETSASLERSSQMKTVMLIMKSACSSIISDTYIRVESFFYIYILELSNDIRIGLK